MAADEGEVGHGSIVLTAERDRVGGEIEPDHTGQRRQALRQVAEAATASAADLEDSRNAACDEAIIQQAQQLGIELQLKALRCIALGGRESVIVGGRLAPFHRVETVVQNLSSFPAFECTKHQLVDVANPGASNPNHTAAPDLCS